MKEWVWEPLKIEKCRDKKLIRRAYAKESKNCHPEEKPEEFKRLYEAYQEALDYAENGEERPVNLVLRDGTRKKQEDIAIPPDDPREEPISEEAKKIRALLHAKEEEKNQKWNQFNEVWQNYLNNITLPGITEKIIEYIKSKEFGGINDDERVLESLAAAIEKNQFIRTEIVKGLNDIFSVLWERSGVWGA